MPLMKMVTLRVLVFAIVEVLAKMVQTSVTGWDGIRKPQLCFWLRFCFLDFRDNDCVRT